jgi:hypothetical protein
MNRCVVIFEQSPCTGILSEVGIGEEYKAASCTVGPRGTTSLPALARRGGDRVSLGARSFD